VPWVKPGSGKSAVPILIPEVVKRGESEIGRFEITNAQFAQFRNSARPAAGLENFPAQGITLDDAKAYVAWLSKLTGQTWRVPYEDEVKDLYENRDGDDTLDYWAGYAPNPEDAARLRAKAKELGGAAPLLKEVGSFRGQGKEDEEPIYDLGGNVAEWALTRDGKGKMIGGSADCPADPKSNCAPAPEYIGFRVVRGAAKPAPTSSEPH
jgi:formylglycine-generating enzyme required for sulfatase activity